MSIETEAPSTTAKAVPAPTHADMMFRYVAGILQTAGVQAFTLAVAVPKGDGTSAILSLAASAQTAPAEWKEEIAKLLGESATKAAITITAPTEPAPEVV